MTIVNGCCGYGLSRFSNVGERPLDSKYFVDATAAQTVAFSPRWFLAWYDNRRGNPALAAANVASQIPTASWVALLCFIIVREGDLRVVLRAGIRKMAMKVHLLARFLARASTGYVQDRVRVFGLPAKLIDTLGC